MRFLLTVVSLLSLLAAPPVLAQERSWVQIESQPNLPQATERARAYAAAFPDVVGFQFRSGWYAVLLGPYSREGAVQRLAELRRDNLIPSDAFVAGSEQFRAPFWPPGTDASAAPLLDASRLPPPVAVTPLDPAPVPEAPAPVAALSDADETPAEARASESLLTREERIEVQAALKEFGFYNAALDGAYGPGTRASMAAWQTATGYEPTGIMTTLQRAAILSELARVRAELDLQTVTEPESGIEVSLPMALVAFDHYEPPFVHYGEKDGSGLRVVLISQPGDRASLSGLFDVLQTLADVPVTGPRALTERSFTIEGRNARIAAHATATLSGGLIKGFLLLWEPKADAKADRVLKAMQASFTPVGDRALDPGLVPLSEAQRSTLMAGMEVRRPALSRSGFYISGTGAVATTTDVLQSCDRITIDRDTEARISFQDDALGLAVLTPSRALVPRRVAGLEQGGARLGTEVAVAGYSFGDALPSPTLTFGGLEDARGLNGEPTLNRLSIGTLEGDAGGPVFDAAGAVLGMLLPADNAARVLPEGVGFLLTAAAVAQRLAEAGITPAPAQRNGALPPEDLSDLAADLTVLVSCWK